MKSGPGMAIWLASLAVYAFLYLPLAVVVLFSFNDSVLNAEWVGFTTRWYARLVHDKDMLQAAANSLLVALLSSSSATILGALAGIAMHRYRPRLLPFLALTPVAMPEILLGVSLLLFFRQVLDLTLGLMSILIAHITFFVAGVGVVTLPLQIYSMIKVAVTPEVNAVSTLLMLLTLSVVFLASRFAPDTLKVQR